MALEQEPAVMNSLNLGLAAKPGDSPYMPMSQKTTTSEIQKASGSDDADINNINEEIKKINSNIEKINSDVSKKVEWSQYPADPSRKAIVLANHDSLTGTTTSGDGANLLMLSKWDVCDLGSSKTHTNLNTKDVVTINDRDMVITDNNISTVVIPGNNIEISIGDASNHKTIVVNSTALSEEKADQKYLTKSDSNTFATKESVTNLENELTNKVDSSYVDQKVADLVNGAPETLDTLKEISDALTESGDVAASLTQKIGSVETKVDAITLESLGGAEKDHKHNLVDIIDYQEPDLSKVVEYKEFEYNGQSRKTIQLNNYDTISGITTGGAGVNLAMVSKWDVADFGSTQVHMNLNTLDGVTINDNKIIATTDQIPDVSNFITSELLNSSLSTKAELTHTHTLDQITDYTAPDLSSFATKDELANKADTSTVNNKLDTSLAESTYATKVELESKADTTALESKLDTETAVSTYATKSEIANFATKDELANKADSDALDAKLDSVLAESTYATKSELQSKTEEFDETKNEIDNLKLEDISQNGVNTSILNRLALLETQVDQLKKTDIEVVSVTSSDTEISKVDKDVIITTEEPITSPTTVVGKSIDFKKLDIESSLVKATANGGDVILTNVQTSGNLNKSVSNAAFSINTNEYVRITQADIQQSGYNCIEIGLSNTEPKNIIIDNIDFTGTLSNNAISVFANADNAVLTISNCHITKCSNFLRLSNRTNHKLTVNIVNCQIDSWETTPAWSGMICLQDYTSKSDEVSLEAKLFASDKITINITNVTGPNGKLVAPEDWSEVIASQDASKQICYIVYGNSVLLPYTGNEDMYPTFNIK